MADQLPEEFDIEFIEKDFPNLERKKPAAKSTRIRKKLVKVRNTFDLL